MFRPSKLLARLRSGSVARVCVTGTPLPYFPAMAAHFGYDAVWVDAEHRAWSPHELRDMFLRARLADVDCLFRPSALDKHSLSRALEDGATALMIPQVNSAEQARELVQHVKFPPLGERGLDGSGLDANFGLPRPADYAATANRETALIVLLETPLAVQSAAEIARVPGVDLVFIGPGDLSLRLGCAPSLAEPPLRSAVERVAAACAHVGRPWGYPVATVDDSRLACSLGASFLVCGQDYAGMQRELAHSAELLRAALAPAP